MTIGEKIKKFRTACELSQKQLAIMSGMREPAIGNYELGNRQPRDTQLEKIAGALNISPLALSNPDLNSYHGIMHSLFELEDVYGFRPQETDGQIVLKDENINSVPNNYINAWYKELKKYKDGEISKEEYDLWRYSFPRMEVERTHNRLRKNRNDKIRKDNE